MIIKLMLSLQDDSIHGYRGICSITGSLTSNRLVRVELLINCYVFRFDNDQIDHIFPILQE